VALKSEFNAVPTLVPRLIEFVHAGSDLQKQFVTRALRELTNKDDATTENIAALEAIPVLVDQSYVRALWNLASIESNRKEIVDEGAIQAIVQQIQNGDSDEHCQLAASFVAVLAQDNVNGQKVAEAGGVKPLVKLLLPGSNG
jgi:hypothetical protein